jgi:fumarate reductase subunit C
MFIQNLFQAITNSISWGTITIAASNILVGRVVTLSESMKMAFIFILPLTAANLIAMELSTLGYVFLIAPGILFTILFSMTAPALLLEHRGFFNSFKRSFIMVRQKIWATITIYSAAWIITFLAQLIISSMMGSFGDLGFYGRFYYSTAKALVDPVLPISLTVHFYSLKTMENKSAIISEVN